MSIDMNSLVAPTTTRDTADFGSHPEVEIGPVTIHKRRRGVFGDEHDDKNDTPLLTQTCGYKAIFQGWILEMNCPKHRLFRNLIQRSIDEEYCLSRKDEVREALQNDSALPRLQAILKCVAPNGDMLYMRDHVHSSLLKTEPDMWRSLMLLVNEKYPGMYTPAHEPLISSYRFSVKFDWMDDKVIQQVFPCVPFGFGTVDRSQNHWLNKCLVCRLKNTMEEEMWCRAFRINLETIRRAMPELRARDVAIKWVYLAKRLVHGL